MRKYKKSKFTTLNYLNIPEDTLNTMWGMLKVSDRLRTAANYRRFYVFIDAIESYGNLVEAFDKFLNAPVAKRTDMMYNPEIVRLKHNVSLERAQEIIDEYKHNKATSLASFILRHGEEEGRKKFEKFQQTSIAPHLWKKSATEEELLEYHRVNSRRCWEFYVDRGFASNQAEGELMACEYQRATAGVHLEIYRTRGLSEQEIADISAAINKKKSTSIEMTKLRYPDDWRERHISKIEKRRITKGNCPPEMWHDRDSYYREVAKATQMSYILYPEHIENTDKYTRSLAFQLDHKVSRFYGFMNDVPPEIIGHPMNLALIPRSENASKRANCSQTLPELLEKIKVYENESN